MRDSFRVSRTPALLRTQTQVNSIRKNRSWITSSDAIRRLRSLTRPEASIFRKFSCTRQARCASEGQRRRFFVRWIRGGE